MDVSSIVITALASLISGGAGAYFGAYLGEKGKNLATREDLDRIVKATEDIKAEITGNLWLRQRVWDFKREAYAGLLEQLSILRQLAFESWTIATVAPRLEPQHAVTMSSNFNVILQALLEFRKRFAVGRLFLKVSVIEALEKVQLGDVPDVRDHAGLRPALEAVMRYADAARESLITEASKDLRLLREED